MEEVWVLQFWESVLGSSVTERELVARRVLQWARVALMWGLLLLMLELVSAVLGWELVAPKVLQWEMVD